MDFILAILAAIFGFTPPAAVPAAKTDGGGVTLELGPSELAEAPLPRIVGARDPDRPLVVIDAGHGGRDPGASAPSGRMEKNATLAIARAIRDEIARSGRVRIAMTRDDDRFIELHERYEIARRLGADLFISVHADASATNDAAHGATIYTLSEVASDREAALLAARENRSGTISGAPLSRDPSVNRILIDLAQRESMTVSTGFARLLRREAKSFFPFRPEYHRFASLIVLKAPDIPSILFESGYISNAADEAYIHSEEGRRQIALGMRRAIEAHFARRIANLPRRT